MKLSLSFLFSLAQLNLDFFGSLKYLFFFSCYHIVSSFGVGFISSLIICEFL